EFNSATKVPPPPTVTGLDVTGLSRTTFYTPQGGANNNFFILGQELTSAISFKLCVIGDRADCISDNFIDMSLSSDSQISAYGFSDGEFHWPPGNYEMVVTDGTGKEWVFPVTVAPKPTPIVDVIFQGEVSTEPLFSPLDSLRLVRTPELVPGACAALSGYGAINACIGNQVQAAIGGTCSVSAGKVAEGIAAIYPGAVDEVFVTCIGSDPSKLSQVAWWFNGAIQVNYTPFMPAFQPVTSPTSHVVFFGGTSTEYVRNPPNDLALPTATGSDCEYESRIWARNICVKNEIQSTIGGTCTVLGGVAAPAIVAADPTAVDEVFLSCTGIDSSKLAGIAGQFYGKSQGSFVPGPVATLPSATGTAYTLDSVTIKFADTPGDVPAGGRLVTFQKYHLEGGYQPQRLGITQFVDPPGWYGGVYYETGWAYEVAITGYL
ncbi:MAG TPA: hypothetical protein VF905_11130, partial [Nitrospirota bacterium]